MKQSLRIGVAALAVVSLALLAACGDESTLPTRATATLTVPSGTTADLAVARQYQRNGQYEEAVAAFLDGTIRFDQIHTVNLRTLETVLPDTGVRDSLDALLALDARARRQASMPLTMKSCSPGFT